MRKSLAFVMSLAVFGAAVWTPVVLFGQIIPGSPFGGGGGGGGSSPPFTDTNALVAGSADPTKLLRFEVDGFSTGTTRVMTFPNADSTIPGLSSNNTWSTGNNTYTGGVIVMGSASNTGGSFASGTAQTPDMPLIQTGTNSNAWMMIQQADSATDFAHAAATHPTLFVHSSNTSPVTEYTGYRAAGTQTELFKTLTESAATSVVQIPVASGASTGGVFFYSIRAADATNNQNRYGRVLFNVVNEAGTETCVLGTPEELDNTPSGTLTVTVTCDTAPTNAVNLQLNAVSSLTQTTLIAYYTVLIQGPGEPLPQ